MERLEQIFKDSKKSRLNIYFLKDTIQEKVKIAKGSSNSLMVIAKGSRSRGYSITEYSFKEVTGFKEIGEKPIEVKWLRSIDKAITLLKASGLWTDMLKDLETAKTVGYEKIKKAYDLSWTNYSDKYEENEKIRKEKVKEVDVRLMEEEHINTGIIWYMYYPLKIKKMNFGYNNTAILQEIATALKDKKKYIKSVRVNYDVGFEYNPEINKAWYSEEYKNCGNGHYYLALDNQYALFYEDD